MFTIDLVTSPLCRLRVLKVTQYSSLVGLIGRVFQHLMRGSQVCDIQLDLDVPFSSADKEDWLSLLKLLSNRNSFPSLKVCVICLHAHLVIEGSQAKDVEEEKLLVEDCCNILAGSDVHFAVQEEIHYNPRGHWSPFPYDENRR